MEQISKKDHNSKMDVLLPLIAGVVIGAIAASLIAEDAEKQEEPENK